METDIRTLVRALAGLTYETFPAEVIKVHEQSVDVMPIGSEVEIFDVRLKAALDEQQTGVIIVPKLGSSVLVTKIAGNDADCFVSMVSEAQEIRVKIGDISYFIDDKSVVFNEGKFGGLIKIEELKKELQKIVQYLEAIKQVFSSTWVVAPSDGGAALKLAMNQALATKTLPDFKDIEDDKVKH